MTALQIWLQNHNRRLTQEAIDEALMEYIAHIETELEAARKDAERYRKLQCFSGQIYEYSAKYQIVGQLNNFVDSTFVPPEMYAAIEQAKGGVK